MTKITITKDAMAKLEALTTMTGSTTMTDDLVKRLLAWDGSPFDEEAHEAAARIEALTDALDNLLEAITAEDQFHDRSLTITGSTANLRWLLEAEDDARAALKGESHE